PPRSRRRASAGAPRRPQATASPTGNRQVRAGKSAAPDRFYPRSMLMTRARLAVVLVAVCGAALAIYLVVDAGVPEVLDALRTAGWVTLAAVSLAHLVPTVLRGMSWRMLFGREARVGWIGFIWARWVREAVDNILPILPVSGVLAGTRVLY